jgi:hypothetical protein
MRLPKGIRRSNTNSKTRNKTYTEKTVMDIKDGRIYRFQPLKRQ